MKMPIKIVQYFSFIFQHMIWRKLILPIYISTISAFLSDIPCSSAKTEKTASPAQACCFCMCWHGRQLLFCFHHLSRRDWSTAEKSRRFILFPLDYQVKMLKILKFYHFCEALQQGVYRPFLDSPAKAA